MIALANLAKRASEGGKLSEQDWARLQELETASKADPLAAAVADLSAQVEQMRAAGGKPTPALLRALRDASLREMGQHVWADAGAAAQELAVSVQTVRNWCDEAGIPAARAAIPKAALYRALWLRAQAQAEKPGLGQSPAQQLETELRIQERQARIDERTGKTLAKALDRARAAVAGAIRDQRHALLNRLPALLAETLCTAADRLAWESSARRLIDHFTAQVSEEVLSSDHLKPPTPELTPEFTTDSESE